MAVTSTIQPDLSLFNVFLYSVAFSAVWAYLWFNPKRQMRQRSWQTYWQFGGYSIFWLLGFKGVITENLIYVFHNLDNLWNYPPVTNLFSRTYFEIEMGWYFSQLFSLAIHTSMKDYYAMLLHHIITPLEIYYSYQCGYAAIGICVMFLHDTSDVALHFAKTLDIFKFRALTDLAFVFFAVSFFVMRLVLLPIFPYAYYFTEGAHQTPCGNVLGMTISVLILLHCFWFYLIVRMVARFIRAGKVEKDIRDEEEDKKLDEDKKVKHS